MGFDWGLSIAVIYGVEIDAPSDLSYYMLRKRLEERAEDDDESLFAKAARAIPSSDFDAAMKSLPAGIASEAHCFKSVIVSRDTETDKEVLKELKENEDEDYFYEHASAISEAAKEVFDKILGKGHGLELRLEEGGAYGEVSHPDASQFMMFLGHAASKVRPTAHQDYYRGGANVPFGCFTMPIPTKKDMTSVDEAISRVVEVLGLTAEGRPSWRLVTVASGG